MGEWISVKDRLPTWKDGYVMVYNSALGRISIGERTVNDRWTGKLTKPSEITHWMPLPEKPKEGKDGMD